MSRATCNNALQRPIAAHGPTQNSKAADARSVAAKGDVRKANQPSPRGTKIARMHGIDLAAAPERTAVCSLTCDGGPGVHIPKRAAALAALAASRAGTLSW
jgi:hypothetical protein